MAHKILYLLNYLLTPVLKSLQWLKIEQRIQYKVAFITYKVLQSEQPSYLHSLLNVQSNRTTRSSDIIPLQRSSIRSLTGILQVFYVTDSYFTHHAPVLWNSLPITAAVFGASITRHCY